MERREFSPVMEAESDIAETSEVLENGTEVIEFRPENIKDEVPVVWVGGFGTSAESYRPALESLAQHDRNVVAFTNPREGVKPAHHREMLPPEDQDKALPPAEMRRALDFIDVINAKNLAKVDIVGHSMGGAAAVFAAAGAPERVRTLTLIDSVGLGGKHSVVELMQRYMKSQAQSAIAAAKQGGDAPGRYMKYLTEGNREVFRNIGLALQEAQDVGETDLMPLLAELHEKGVKISIIHATEDAMFPQDNIQKMLKAETIDGYVSIRGQHEESFVYRPDETMAATDALIDAMVKKQQAESKT